MQTETERRAIFRTSPLLMGFLSTLLEDLQFSEREEGDSGTIWDCPDATFNAARSICDRFYALDIPVAESACSYEQIGGDLYLEAAGHGAGFRDREHDSDSDVSQDIGERLSAAVDTVCTHLETYLGDDGCAYIVGREMESVA